MEILKVQNLCKTYGTGEAKVDALKNVSFSLEKGEFVAVVGESGSGKSTLLNCIGALDVPTSGTVTMDGNNLFSMKEEERTIFRRRNIGFIFQSFQLVSELTVEQNIAFPLLLDYRKPKASDVEEILELLGLTERRNHLPSQLSGGQQQRVSIARALAGNPSVILADEPTGALDSRTGREVLGFLQKLNQEGDTVVLITHDNSIAVKAKRIVRLQDGRIIYDGDASDPAAVVFDSIQAAKARGTDVVIIDTAGRLHNKTNLMNELNKITRVIRRELPEADVETLMVLDATTGQNGLTQARIFREVVDVTGIVLTKLDGSAKGGFVLAVQERTGIPVKLLGQGEDIGDLTGFTPHVFVEQLVG